MVKYTRILVAVDGSKESDAAFMKAVAIAKRNEADLFITHIIEVRLPMSRGYKHTLTDAAKINADKILDEYERYAKNHGIKNVNIILETGSPKQLISEEIPKKHSIELIILGAVGVGAVGRFFMGSVSGNVSAYAVCDVLIVRTDEQQRPMRNYDNVYIDY